MGSFGERLRREREMRGINIEEIAEATKIGSRNLRALEEEHFDQLPGGIFNKGFVRAYSKYLGLDEEQAVADYVAAENAFRESSTGRFDVPVENTRRSSKALPVVVVLLIAIGAGGFFGWRYYQKRAAKRQAERAATAVSNAVPPVAAPTPAPPVEPVATAAQPDAGTQAPNAANAAQSAGAASLANTPSTTPAATPAATGGTPPPEAAPAVGFVVQIKAKQDSWVSAKADGKSVLSGTLKAANEKTVHARDRIVLTLGNAGGVQVSYNGKDLDLGNAAGQVKKLTFTAQGLQPDVPEQRQ